MEPPYVDTVFWGKNDQRCDEAVTSDLETHLAVIDNRATEAHSSLLVFGIFAAFIPLLALMVAWHYGLTAFALVGLITLVVTLKWTIPVINRQAGRYHDWMDRRKVRTIQFQQSNLA